MKYKLPERFKLSKIEKSERIHIYDSVKQIWTTVHSIKEVFERIEAYLMALEKIEGTKVPNGYQIIVTSMECSQNSQNCMLFLIDYEGNAVMASPSFEHLLLEATNSPKNAPVKYITEENQSNKIPLILRIKALNNGEEIEL